MRAQFVLSEIGVGLRRNLTMTFAVIVSVALSLALVRAVRCSMREQVSTMKGYWYDKVNVSIFLCNKNDAESDPNCAKGAVTGAAEGADPQPSWSKMTVVDKVYHESADEAYKHYKEQFERLPAGRLPHPGPDAGVLPRQAQGPREVPGRRRPPSPGGPGVQAVQDQRTSLENLFNLLNGMNIAAAVRDGADARRRADADRQHGAGLGVQPAAGDRASCGWSAPPASTSRCRSSWRPRSPV